MIYSTSQLFDQDILLNPQALSREEGPELDRVFQMEANGLNIAEGFMDHIKLTDWSTVETGKQLGSLIDSVHGDTPEMMAEGLKTVLSQPRFNHLPKQLESIKRGGEVLSNLAEDPMYLLERYKAIDKAIPTDRLESFANIIAEQQEALAKAFSKTRFNAKEIDPNSTLEGKYQIFQDAFEIDAAPSLKPFLDQAITQNTNISNNLFKSGQIDKAAEFFRGLTDKDVGQNTDLSLNSAMVGLLSESPELQSKGMNGLQQFIQSKLDRALGDAISPETKNGLTNAIAVPLTQLAVSKLSNLVGSEKAGKWVGKASEFVTAFSYSDTLGSALVTMREQLNKASQYLSSSETANLKDLTFDLLKPDSLVMPTGEFKAAYQQGLEGFKEISKSFDIEPELESPKRSFSPSMHM